MKYKLEEIHQNHAAAFLRYCDDYRANEPESKFYSDVWSILRFHEFVKDCEKQRMDWRPKVGKTSITRYVLVDDRSNICANGIIMFPLGPAADSNFLFDVPPSLRRQGFGTLIVNRMLFEAVRAGLARARVCCAADNVGAIKAIEKNRGCFDETAFGINKYWINLR